MRRFVCMVMLCVLIGMFGCTRNPRQMDDNLFTSDLYPTLDIAVNTEYKFLGKLTNNTTRSGVTWNKDVAIYFKDDNGDKVVDSGVYVMINKISTEFGGDYYREAVPYYFTKDSSDEGALQHIYFATNTDYPDSYLSKMLVDYIRSRGLKAPKLVLVHSSSVRLERNVVLEFGYCEDVSGMPYDAASWNKLNITEDQFHFLTGFLEREKQVLVESKKM